MKATESANIAGDEECRAPGDPAEASGRYTNQRKATGMAENAEDGPMTQLMVEVFSPPALMLEGLCSACEVAFGAGGMTEAFRQDQFDTFPLDLVEEAARCQGMVGELVERHQGRVVVKILDPQSIEGLWKGIRHRVGKYPTWIVGGKTKVKGWDSEQLDLAIRSQLQG